MEPRFHRAPWCTAWYVCVALFALLGAVPAAIAQVGTGTIQGTVRDASGAVVPNVNLRIVHTQTTRTYTAVTNDAGVFVAPSLQMGSYEITAEASGMETWKGQLTLIAGQTAEIEAVLKVGSTGTTVTVAGDITPLVTTTGPTLANNLERARIEQLPTNGRYIQNLVLMTTPGLEAGSVPRLYGLRYAVEYYQDGAILANRDWSQLPARPPGIDTIGEVRVETSNSSAKMNRPGSIVLTTRSGTNEWHGALFETHRNNALGLARARQDFSSSPPKLIRNEFGASLGGPVWLPKLYDGRNKTFFFAAYEGFRQRQATARAISVPTAAMREGDFSGLVDASGRPFTLYDPWSTGTRENNWARTPFPGNRIPVERRSPLAAALYAITPLPNQPNVNPLVAENWFGTGFDNLDQNTFTARVDHQITDKDQVFFRFSWNPSLNSRTNSGIDAQTPTTLDGRANGAVDDWSNINGVATWNHIFSPTLFSETVFTMSSDYRAQVPISGLGNIAAELGLPNPFLGGGFPRVRDTGVRMNYDTGINYTINDGKIVMVDENLSKVWRTHEFQFGGRFRYEWLDTLVDQTEAGGNHNFLTNATGLYDPSTGSLYGPAPFTGHATANFFLGIANYNARFNRGWFRMRSGERALYFQDNWKVSPRLTLNLGLRYEYAQPGRETNNALISYDPTQKSIVLGRPVTELESLGVSLPGIVNAYSAIGATYQSVEESSLPRNFVNADKLVFGPRLGFAYRMGSNSRATVLRGGYSIFSYPESLRLYNGTMAQNVPGQAVFSYDVTSAATSPDGLPNYALRSTPTVIAGLNSANVIDINRPGGIARGSGVMHYFNPDQPLARAAEWNLIVEREIGREFSVRIGYVGTHGYNLSQWYAYNEAPSEYIWFTTRGEPYPTGPFANVARRGFDQETLGTIREYRKSGFSNSNNFQFEVNRRYSRGIGFQFFYTLSNSMRAGGDGWRDDIMQAENLFLPGAVPSDYDERNRFLNYRRDITIPKHRLNGNWVIDLPFGKGRRFAGQAGRFTDALIGGWQIAGNAEAFSRYFTLPTSNWGELGKVELYGKDVPVQDCRSGQCFDGWLWYNGYVPANRVNSTAANGAPNGVMGVPENYVPSNRPVFATPANGIPAGDPNASLYETNTVFVRLKDGTQQRTTINNNLHPWRNQYVPAPWVSVWNASLFKTVRLTESVLLRFNADAFNVFNMPGLTLPDAASGVLTTRLSQNAPRNLQLTMRLTW